MTFSDSKTDLTLSGQQALDRLKQGNARFVANLSNPKSIETSPPTLVEQQNPHAIILGCSDARVPAEIVFDQGLGDLFVIRVAGNIVAPSQIGSIEFAASAFDTPLVVVLGHSHCGAVTATVNELMLNTNESSPNLRSIVNRISPSVLNLYELAQAGGQAINKEVLLQQSIRANVRASVNQLRHGSRLLEDLVESGDLLIVGAEYNVMTGQVDFFDKN